MNLKAHAVMGAIFLVLSANVTTVPASDIDEDGLDDAFEQTLIDMYRPVLHYDPSENVRPASVEWYVRHSDLLLRTHFQGNTLDLIIVPNSQLNDPGDPNSPLRLLFVGNEDLPGSTTAEEPANVGYRINCQESFQHGPPPPVEPVGMYAHVVPLLNPLSYTNGPTIPPPPQNHDDFLLLQYWQFFPFNDFQFTLDIGNHEGDWMWIDVFVERECPNAIHYIVYHHHGDSECAPLVLGPGFDQLPLPESPFPLACSPDNLVPTIDCFLEAGAHEWWPYSGSGGECEFCVPCLAFTPCCAVDCCKDNGPHRGTALSQRSMNVLNLGERFAPMPGIEPQLVMLFNGLWGHNAGFPNGPSGGPLRQESPGYPFSPLMVAYVDPATALWASIGLGSRFHPFPTLEDAIDGPNAVETGGCVRIAPGDYSANHQLSRPMRLERLGASGVVVLRQ